MAVSFHADYQGTVFVVCETGHMLDPHKLDLKSKKKRASVAGKLGYSTALDEVELTGPIPQ